MPLTSQQRLIAWNIFCLIRERDMPSNCTSHRLVERSGLDDELVLWAIDFLWADDAGFIRVDVDRRTGERGYFVDPKCKKKTPQDLDALFAEWELRQEDLDEEAEEEDEDPDDEWDEMDEDLEDD